MPIGVGIITTALKQGVADARAVAQAVGKVWRSLTAAPLS